jgi:hypothetical protein
MKCDSCGVTVSSKGFLGGDIICHECAEAKRKGNQDVIKRRKEKYSDA